MKNKHLVRLGGFFEKRFLAGADKIITRTPAVTREYLRIYPDLERDRFIELYGGIDWEEYDSVKPESEKNEFTICHTGLLYADTADPAPFFHALSDLVSERLPIRLLLLGEVDPETEVMVKKMNLEENVTFTGHRPYSEVVHYQRSSSMLLAFSPTTPYKIPSKIGQYIAARRPILLITDLDCDPSADLVFTNNRGLVSANSKDRIREAILRIYEYWEKDVMDEQFDFSQMSNISYQYIAASIKKSLRLA
jgi:glycosyltransferase involved in cell wall biosynthesis